MPTTEASIFRLCYLSFVFLHGSLWPCIKPTRFFIYSQNMEQLKVKTMTQLSAKDLIKAAQEFGTPLYVYHAEKIKDQYAKLAAAFRQSNVVFFYACKALTNISVLKYIKSLGANIDCSSINEAKLALHAGFLPHQILYTSNGIGFDEIEEAVLLKVNINIDSLSNLEKFGKKYGHVYPVGIRLRPNIMAGGHLKMSTGHDKKKIGITVVKMGKIKEEVAEKKKKNNDLHNQNRYRI